MKTVATFLFSFFLIMLGFGFTNRSFAQTTVSGCIGTSGYSATTGQACNGATTIPAGCTTTSGFSGVTGQPCNGATASANGFNGIVYGTNGYLNGCTSTSGFSTTTGQSCYMASTTATGGTTATGTTTGTTAPGFPTTGAGGELAQTLFLLVLSGFVGAYGFITLRREMKK